MQGDRWTARVQAGEDGDVDLVLRAPALVQRRDVVVDGEGIRSSTWRLPCSRLCVISLRLSPGRSESAVRRFEIDRGDGPEAFGVLVRCVR